MRLSKHIAPHYHKTFHSKKVHQIDSGGRGSTKTSKNGLKIPYHMVNDNNCNVVAIRKNKNTLRNSLFAELKRGLKRLGLKDGIHYKSTVSPMRIKILKNGNTCYFGGLDDYEKLKGMIAENDEELKITTPEDLAGAFVQADVEFFDYENATKEDLIALGDLQDEVIEEDSIKLVWMSEITEIKDEDDILQTVATFSRGEKDYFCVLYEYNPPKNKFHWINQWAELMKDRDDCQVTHTDYRTVPEKWLGPIFIQQALELQKNDLDRYNHIYLGMVTGLDGLIYNYDHIQLIEMIEEIDDDGVKTMVPDLIHNETILYIDIYIDTGHQTSATIFLCVGMTSRGRIVLLDTYYYSPNGKTNKKAPSDFSDDLWTFLQTMCATYECSQDTMIIDSAEGGIRNQFKKDYSIELRPVVKKTKEGMIDIVQDLLATKNFHVVDNDNNYVLLLEHKSYEWKEGTVEAGKPEPDKTEKKFKIKYYNTHAKEISYYYAEHTCDGLQYGVIMNLRKYGLKF